MPCKYATAKEVIERYRSFLIGLPIVMKGMQYKINHLVISTPKEIKETFLACCKNNLDNETALKLITPQAQEFNVYVVHYNSAKKNFLYSELSFYLNHFYSDREVSRTDDVSASAVNIGIKRISTDLMYSSNSQNPKSISA